VGCWRRRGEEEEEEKKKKKKKKKVPINRQNFVSVNVMQFEEMNNLCI
jgi:hypothetical protein